ncbi:MAG: hydrogenase 3 maturation endopeptidase HyCI [Aminivibrio sp.]|jgi:hydrogenase 3 maturation protease
MVDVDFATIGSLPEKSPPPAGAGERRVNALVKTVLWCVGNPIMADDGAGPALYRELLGDPAEGVSPVNCETAPENYLGPLKKNPPRRLVVADAAEMGLPPGSVRRIDLERSGDVSFSSHGIPLFLLLEPLKDDVEIVLIGIQPESRGMGEHLSPRVRGAVKKIAGILRRGEVDEIEPYQENRSPR